MKHLLDHLTHPLGIDIVRYFGSDLGLKQIQDEFSKHKINLILDIGANTGQYAMSVFESGYKGKIISFEPLIEAHNILKKNESSYNNWKIYERIAIGDLCGKTTINISENSHSSSILPISTQHTKVAPSAKYIGQTEVSIITLDTIFPHIASSNENICLKIDTQGFEDKVLAGALASLKSISLIQLELSLIPLYDGSKTIEWMLPYLKVLDFYPAFFLPGFIDRTTGQIQQIEGLFFRKSNS